MRILRNRLVTADESIMHTRLRDKGVSGAGGGFGSSIRARRILAGQTLRQASDLAGLSKTYLAQIETGSLTPPRETCERILRALHVPDREAHQLLGIAALERGSSEADEQLPLEIRALIREVRRYAYVLPEAFTRGLRTAIREIVR
jgi:transcriptional regulator with XRE-family HTH domain